MEHRITSPPATSGDRASPTLREMFRAHISKSRSHLTTHYRTRPQHQVRHHQRPQLPTQQPHPRFFGHPHRQAPPQATEPFWHQYPYWTQHQLYYYSDFGYLDQPLYTAETMDREPATMIGSASQFSKTHQQNGSAGSSTRKHNPGPKVDVYVGDELVGSISLWTLTRFSDAGKRVFPRPQQQGADKVASPKKVSTTASQKIDSGLDWAEDANAAGSDAVAERSKEPSSTEPKAQPATPIPATAPVSLAYARPHMQKRTFQLELDVVEMPSTKALADVVKWMKDNESVTGNLIDYGPPRLDNIQRLDVLIDLYQAALAFELKPWAKGIRIQKEIRRRVSEGPLGVSAFKQVSRWLPTDDQVMVRCINSMEYYRRRGAYTEAEVKEVETFLQLPGNEKLNAAFVEVDDEFRIRHEARQGQPNQRQQQYQQRGGGSAGGGNDGSSKDATSVDQETGSKQTENESKDEKQTPRRRKRRAQKAKGKGKQDEVAEGTEVKD